MAERRSTAQLTNCHICNILNSGILDKSNNEWLADHYSGEHAEALGIAALTNWFNESLLHYYFLKQHPYVDPTFDFRTLRKYLQKIYIDNDDHIDSKLFSIGNSIVKHFDLDPVYLSARFVTPHSMQHHLQDCLGIRQVKSDYKSSTSARLLQAVEFAHRILQNPLDNAISNGLASPDTQIVIYVKDMDTGEMYPVKEWISRLSEKEDI